MPPWRPSPLWKELATQLDNGSTAVFGVMIESFLVEGNQKVIPGQELTYGQSITDACVNLEQSTEILDVLSTAVKA